MTITRQPCRLPPLGAKPGSTDPPTAPWRPGTPSHPMKSWGFMGTPGSRGPTSAVLTYAFSECARSGPRRRPTIWRTWTPIRSPRIGESRLSGALSLLWRRLVDEDGDAVANHLRVGQPQPLLVRCLAEEPLAGTQDDRED